MQLDIVSWTPAGVSAIPLRRVDKSVRAYSFIDVADYEAFARYSWAFRNGYAIRLQGMHRDVLDAPPGTIVDHRNGFRLDNRRSNLRFATPRENAQSRRSHRNSSSRYRGVSWDRNVGKWRAYAMLDDKLKTLGFFIDETKAAETAAAFRRTHMPFSTT